MNLTIYGFKYSVYCRIISMICHEKGVAADWIEVNPFDGSAPADYGDLHPFGRVPVVVHGDFALYETAAIAGYVDEAFPGPSLQPEKVKARARMAQIVAIVDSYAYIPLVRQVFSHRVFRPMFGQPSDEQAIHDGLSKAKVVLKALEAVAADGPFIADDDPSLADFHLAAMIDYFAASEEGRDMLEKYPKLSAWWANLATRESVTATNPLD